VIFGNRNKKKGDIVKVARWAEEDLARIARDYPKRKKKPDDVHYCVVQINHAMQTVLIEPLYSRDGSGLSGVDLNDTNLIKIGTIN